MGIQKVAINAVFLHNPGGLDGRWRVISFTNKENMIFFDTHFVPSGTAQDWLIH